MSTWIGSQTAAQGRPLGQSHCVLKHNSFDGLAVGRQLQKNQMHTKLELVSY